MKAFRQSRWKVTDGPGIKVETLQEVKERVSGGEIFTTGVNFSINQIDMKMREETRWVA